MDDHIFDVEALKSDIKNELKTKTVFELDIELRNDNYELFEIISEYIYAYRNGKIDLIFFNNKSIEFETAYNINRKKITIIKDILDREVIR